jgi:hypothetical protein
MKLAQPMLPLTSLLRGHSEAVLKYFDTFPGPHDFPMRSLASSAVSTWTYPGPAYKRVTFESQSFTPSLSHLLLRLNNLDTLYLQIQTFLLFSITQQKTSSVFKSPSRTITATLGRIQAWLKRGTLLGDLRPSISGKHWPLIFVVPEVMAPDYKLQDFEGDTKM